MYRVKFLINCKYSPAPCRDRFWVTWRRILKCYHCTNLILKEFLSERKQGVPVNGKFSNTERVLSGVPQGSVLGPLVFILFTADLGENLENKIVSYADDTTLFARISNPSEHISVARYLNRDLAKIQS